jgi:hypothetical protein
VGAFPSRLAFLARFSVFFSGMGQPRQCPHGRITNAQRLPVGGVKAELDCPSSRHGSRSASGWVSGYS